MGCAHERIALGEERLGSVSRKSVCRDCGHEQWVYRLGALPRDLVGGTYDIDEPDGNTATSPPEPRGFVVTPIQELH